mgnify:CR=1 FL=1
MLKAEITALESLGMGKTISNPKVFTLDNQLATVTQGEEIPYQTKVMRQKTNIFFREATHNALAYDKITVCKTA